MSEFFGVFGTHLKRGIVSVKFIICTVFLTALMIISILEIYSEGGTYHGLNYFFSRLRGHTSDYFMMMIICFPAVMLFYEDWTSGNFKFIVNRAGRCKYMTGTVLAAGVTAAAVTIAAYLIFSLFVLTKFPLLPQIAEADQFRVNIIGFPNSGLLLTENGVLCYVLYILSQGARAAFYASAALFQSIIITNKHLTAISPVLLYICYFTLNLFNYLPVLLNPYVLFWNGFRLYLVFGGTQDGSLFSPIAAAYPFIYCGAMLLILSLAGSRLLRIKMNRSI